MSFEEMEEKAVDTLVKLEKLLDKGSEKNIYFPEHYEEGIPFKMAFLKKRIYQYSIRLLNNI